MRVIAVDDERLALESLRLKLTRIERINEVHTFSLPEAAQAYVENNEIDVAFLDISMAQMDGLTLARRLREQQPNIYIIFVTGYSEYALDAFKLHADGYLTKPIDEEDIKRELDALERHVSIKVSKRIRAHTFGNFELFIDGEIVKFRLARCKELLAYLIDRQGASCNTSELCAILFEDDSNSHASRSHFRILISELTKTLRESDAENLLIKQRNSFAVNAELIDCDMYRFFRGESAAINAYAGEYMCQYSWAELRIGQLESYTERIR